MMRRELILAPAAARDIRRITEKTRLDWSLAQSIEYAEALFAGFQRIAANPEIGRTRNELGHGLRADPFNLIWCSTGRLATGLKSRAFCMSAKTRAVRSADP